MAILVVEGWGQRVCQVLYQILSHLLSCDTRFEKLVTRSDET